MPQGGDPVTTLGEEPAVVAEDLAEGTVLPSRPAARRVARKAPGVATASPVYHRLERGMTLYSLARAYRVPLADLMRANRITDPTTIPEGTAIRIPGVSRPLTPAAPSAPGLAWPLRGAITSGFGARGREALHAGIDIDGDMGDRILAAATGTVVEARSERQYGRVIVIDHGHGLSTLYAHADCILVKPGQTVRQGQEIARVGRTGNARGTHLHFEVRRDGRAVNPLPLLDSGSLTARAAPPGKAAPRPAQATVLPR